MHELKYYKYKIKNSHVIAIKTYCSFCEEVLFNPILWFISWKTYQHFLIILKMDQISSKKQKTICSFFIIQYIHKILCISRQKFAILFVKWDLKINTGPLCSSLVHLSHLIILLPFMFWYLMFSTKINIYNVQASYIEHYVPCRI